jgi:hypothetical protein
MLVSHWPTGIAFDLVMFFFAPAYAVTVVLLLRPTRIPVSVFTRVQSSGFKHFFFIPYLVQSVLRHSVTFVSKALKTCRRYVQ